MRRFIIGSILFLGLLALYSYRLNFPEKEYYDEVYHVVTAREFISLSGNTDNTHPPLGKLMIAGTILALGDQPWVWRLTALFCGLGTLLVFFLLAEKFFKDTRWALLATALLTLDGFSITQSRLAMLNTPMVLFMLLTVYFWRQALENKNRARNYFLTGIFLGLTAATRWVGLGVTLVMGILFLEHGAQLKSKEFWKNIFLYLLLPAVVIYFITHAILPFIKGYSWKDLWLYQQRMLHYHSTLKAGHSYGSPWWSWPLMTRPIWYFFERREGWVYGIFCIGNPAVMWMFFPALGYLIWDVLKTRSRQTAFVLAGFLSQWLPWAFIGRVKFFHYYYPAMPFVILAVVLYMKALWNAGRLGKIFVGAYAFLVLALFCYWYPLYVGAPVSEKFFQQHLWFKSWI